MATYLLDANVFIESKNRHYGFDFCPAFWDWIDRANRTQSVFSVAKVYDEIQQGFDELAEWAKPRRGDLFLDADEAVLASLRVTSQWVSEQGYRQDAVAEFLRSADYYLIAHAHALSCVVVTHERLDNSRRKVKIPNVCGAFNVQCVTPFDMLRTESARFVLGDPIEQVQTSSDHVDTS